MKRYFLPLTAAGFLVLPCAGLLAQTAQENPTITMVAAPPNTSNLTWLSVAGRAYYFQVSSSLQPDTWFYPPVAAVVGTGGILTQPITCSMPPDTRCFIRIKWADGATAVPGADYDGDSIPNQTEINNGTDPFLDDTDSDGLNDDKEAALGFNPNKRDSSVPPNGIEDPWEVLQPAQASLIVSEYQASNKATIADSDGENKDWLEIFNFTSLQK